MEKINIYTKTYVNKKGDKITYKYKRTYHVKNTGRGRYKINIKDKSDIINDKKNGVKIKELMKKYNLSYYYIRRALDE